ncbi:MAG: glycosyltransferase family 4 protein [Devosiaceae bacterium]|nr:glycosyltransferase family 4 protein [Devosiaceae bacterium]
MGSSPKKIKVLFVHTQDWFFLSHFKPLADAINSDDKFEAGIVTTVGDDRAQLEELGLKLHPIDFQRASFSPFSAAKICLQLVSILHKERPDIVHFVALKPILVGGFAMIFFPKKSRVYHVTGMGYLADGNSKLAACKKNIVFRLMAFFINRARGWLITENPDDLTFLKKYGARQNKRTSILGGAGVDPDYYTQMPAVSTDVPKAAFVGRMIWSKGVDVLVEAKAELAKRSVQLDLDLYGEPDLANPYAVSNKTMESWGRQQGIKWHGLICDVREVWRNCEICIIPTRTREGMPRAMLEAASCGRAIIVTDVPGCRHFIRHGVEGLIVPPDDPIALADAMQKLAQNPELRKSMGVAARQRVLAGYTEKSVRKEVLRVYDNLLGDDLNGIT